MTKTMRLFTFWKQTKDVYNSVSKKDHNVSYLYIKIKVCYFACSIVKVQAKLIKREFLSQKLSQIVL